jgi:hypothetical protein
VYILKSFASCERPQRTKSAKQKNQGKRDTRHERTQCLPLLPAWPRLALIPNNGMQLDLDRILCIVAAVPLAPVVADSVREDVSSAREARRCDAAADFGVALEAVLCVLVPEVECAVGPGGAEGAVHGVEGDCVDGVDFCDVAGCRVGLAVAFE